MAYYRNMIRFSRISSLRPGPYGFAILAFLLGLIGGTAVGLTVEPTAPSATTGTDPEIEIVSKPFSKPAPPAGAVRALDTASLPADVLRVIDGDTFEARVHVWPGLDITTKVRLRGIDAAELRARCPAERAKAETARDALSAMLADGPVGVFGISLDKYGGRVVADARTRSIANVSAELLGRGLARSYSGRHRDGWCDGKL
jgi:endonuclease YncB( thermonuclease family)